MDVHRMESRFLLRPVRSGDALVKIRVCGGRLLPGHETEVTVTYTFTALSPAGDSYLESLTETAFREMIEGWQTAISRHLAEADSASSSQ